MSIAIADINEKLGEIPGLEDNIDTLNSNTPLFKSFVRSLDLTILNTLPILKGLFKHFIEKSSLIHDFLYLPLLWMISMNWEISYTYW